MVRVSINITDDIVRDKLARRFMTVFRRWLRDLGKDRADLVEAISVKTESHSGWLLIHLKIVLVDPVMVYDGVIIKDRPKLEAMFCIRYDPEKLCFDDPFDESRMSTEFDNTLETRAKMLQNNVDELRAHKIRRVT